tara:strand:- start:7472 stop:8836 length:1365 start_codon:yes stop_codon:yes gene_type:complete
MKKSNLPIAIIGLGKTGLSVAKYFHRNNQKFIAYDTRKKFIFTKEITKYLKKEDLVLGEIKNFFIDQHDNFIISPGVDLDKKILEEIKNNNKNIQTDIDIFNESGDKKVICITGSNGKTTVTSIIEHILNNIGKKSKAGGNIGLPALELLYEKYEYYILELSSFQLEMTKKIKCESSMITNITPDHLDRHKTFKNYISIKHKIFENTKNIIINRSDKNIKKNKYNFKYTFGGDSPKDENSFGINNTNGINYIYQGKEKILSENDIKLIGYHNLINICSALAAIKSLGLDVKRSAESIKYFEILEHRMENFYNYNNIMWINDSKATNVESTISAVNSLKNNVILLMGGRSKTDDYSELNKAIFGKVKYLILFGECRNLLFEKIKSVENIIKVKDINSAVIKAKNFSNNFSKKTEIKISIVLSPACSSYDSFESYEERGNFFKKCVLNENGMINDK